MSTQQRLIETEEQLLAQLAALSLSSDEQRNAVVCALIGHSNIISMCFGYVYCGRCGAQIGDKLGGVYDDSKKVVIGHNCDTCRENYEATTWEDRLFVPDPFVQEEVEEATP